MRAERQHRRKRRRKPSVLRGILLYFVFFVGIIGLFSAMAGYLNDKQHRAKDQLPAAVVSASSATFAPVRATLRPSATSAPTPAQSPSPAPTPVYMSPEAARQIAASIAEAISGPQGTPQSAVTPFMTAAPTKAPAKTTAGAKKQSGKTASAPRATAASTPIPGTNYVLNRNTKKFHVPSCRDVKKIKDSNRVDYFGTYKQVTQMGYKPCGHCNPH